ncbi:DUF6193 family natural product biosynthesis protein [Streptomyces sp. CBMA156]|uniref:DUF6193 family natural product biosynthesis protein n=1 Tax=Streptomyces sp. CBMA156 TaxID=1930280 RepID=UPI001661B5B8|nr:DUF6193 family natural product biosynthesis protein [Streptomyces sp. CBMA156]MBD0674727.1 hypothetical protein [Streptomyces sp. CBMA156]
MRSDDQKDVLPEPGVPNIAEARAVGPEAAVEARWEILTLRWEQVRREVGHGPDSENAGLVRLLRAARAEPRLARFFPFTSHYNLWFSLATSPPYVVAGMPYAEPLYPGGYHVRRPGGGEVIGTPATAEEAVALLVEHLPPDLGPVFNHPEDGPR